ncbi:MAG TPA: hypothetical protein VMI31_18030 [Fimbriimonadaceae bacterium]|nr:hypothetical protein [Fimbriimonadaceae bacterium]
MDTRADPTSGIAEQRAPQYMATWSCGGGIETADGVTWTIIQNSTYTSPIATSRDVPLFPPSSGEDTESDHHFGWHWRQLPGP